MPRWVRLVDALSVALVLIALSVAVTGGFREWTPLGRLSVTSWSRPLILALVAILIRHFIHRSPTLPARVAAATRRWWTSEETRAIWPIFIGSRLGVLIVGFLGIALIGYGNTPPWRVYPNEFLNLPARWDTGWYLGIASDGYDFNPGRINQQQNIAFFPFFPMLMRYGSLFLARQTMWTGVVIALIAFFFALRYLVRWARPTIGDDSAIAGIAFLAAYPFALFYSTAYSEALLLLTSVAACYHFERNEWWKAALWGLAAGLSRPNGCLLSVALAFLAIKPMWAGQQWSWRSIAERIGVAAMPGIGMLIYAGFIYQLTGNPLQWAAQNAAWGRVYRGVGGLVSDRIDFLQQNGFYDYASNQTLDMIQAVAVLFVLGSVWPVFRRFGLAYAVLILVNVMPPLVMGGLLSMGRVTSVIFPSFLWLGAAIPAQQRFGWLTAFALLQALCAIAFFTWRPLY